MARNEEAELVVLAVVQPLEANLKMLPEDHLPELQAFVATRDTKGLRVKSMMNSHNPRIRDYFIGSAAAHVVLHAGRDVLIVGQKGQ